MAIQFTHREITRNSYHTLYLEARAIHAFLLRCEGLKLSEIGSRIGNLQHHQKNDYVGKQQVRCLIADGARRLNYAMRKTRFYWKNDDGFDPLA